MLIHNNALVALSRAELDRREARRAAYEHQLLGALFAGPGFTFVPAVTVDAGHVQLSEGSAVAGSPLTLIRIPAQRVLLPTEAGEYALFVKPDAAVDLGPFVTDAGVAGYLDRASDAYASGQLPAAEGVILTIGLMILPRVAAGPDWLELAAVSVPADASQTTVAVTADLAPLRGAAQGGGSLDGALLADGSVPLTGGLNANGKTLSNVGAITPASGTTVNVNAAKLGGYTAAQILASVNDGGPSTAPDVYKLNFTRALGADQQAPKTLQATLGALDPGLQTAVNFEGAGELIAVNGGTLTFRPEVRGTGTRRISWPSTGADVRIGVTVGVAGLTPAYFTSLSFNTPATDTTPAQHRRVLLRTTPAGVVSVHDQEITANADASGSLAPYPIDVSSAALTWGGRPQNVTLTPQGDPNNPNTNTASVYVAGTRAVRADQDGLELEDLTVAVQGTVTVYQAPTFPTLELS